jgi:hypothetical protein
VCDFSESYFFILQDEVQSVSMDIGWGNGHQLSHARDSGTEMDQTREAGDKRQSMKEWLKKFQL